MWALSPFITFASMPRNSFQCPPWNALQACMVFMVALAGGTTLGFGQGHSGELQWLPNQGQWEVPALARADWAGGVTWLEEDGMNIWVAGEGYDELWAHQDDRLTAFDPEALLTSHGWQVHWEGSGPDPVHEVLSEAGHRVNVYLGQDPSRWAEGLVPETRFKLHDVWPGIDLRVGPRTRGDQAELPGPGWKEDWIVHPGADAAKVAIRHEGASLSLLPDGSLRCQLGETAAVGLLRCALEIGARRLRPHALA